MVEIEIDTGNRILKVFENGSQIKEYPVAVGKASTPTPKGNWTITKKALWGEQFGGHFMQLSVPWGVYGVHGTNKPWSIGQAVSPTGASACTTAMRKSCTIWFP